MNMILRITTNLLALGCFLTVTTNAARILGIFTVPGMSHFRFNNAIMESLHAAGHQITLIASFQPERRDENFTYIDINDPNVGLMGQFNINELTIPLRQLLKLMIQMNFNNSYRVVRLPEIQNLLRSSEKPYDILVIEYLYDFESYLPLAEKLKIPVIATVAQRRWRWADQTIGLPNNPAVIPGDLCSSCSDVEMSFVERVHNLWTGFTIDEFYVRTLRQELHNFYRKYFADDLIDKKEVSLIFYNNHPSLIPQPSVPNAIDIGGIHLKDAKPLPTHLQTFIDEAPHGVILFSLGSLFKSSSMLADQMQAFLTAFALIPQRVIWKFDRPIENLSKNIFISSWLPQRDILEHKNVTAFMSHCGLNGVYEAIVTNTPIITMPLFADQTTNAAFLRNRGVAVNLDFHTVTKEKVLIALDTIINDTSYYRNMQQLSRAFKDRPMTARQSVVYWTEYVLRHNGASHLKALGTDIPLYKYFMLDIITLALVILCFVISMIFCLVRKFRTFFANERDHTLAAKKER